MGKADGGYPPGLSLPPHSGSFIAEPEGCNHKYINKSLPVRACEATKDFWQDHFYHTTTDLYDCWHTNLAPGPWHLEKETRQWRPPSRKRFSPYREFEVLGSDQVKLKSEDLDKLAELHMLLQMLKDCLESWEADHAASVYDDEDEVASVASDMIDAHSDALKLLVSAEETFKSCNDILLRVVELALGRDVAPGDLTNEKELNDFGLQAMRSGLGLAVLLEAALGELTNYQLGPCSEERCNWRQWQRMYLRVTRTIQQKNKHMESNPSTSRCDAAVCQSAVCWKPPGPLTHVETTTQHSPRGSASSHSQSSSNRTISNRSATADSPAIPATETAPRDWRRFCCMTMRSTPEASGEYDRSSVDSSSQKQGSSHLVAQNSGSSPSFGPGSSVASLFTEIQRRYVKRLQ